ncbi:MAG: hypothetical protein NXI31_20755 [bacterium]|nr:hypothetical protein [bacterium]
MKQHPNRTFTPLGILVVLHVAALAPAQSLRDQLGESNARQELPAGAKRTLPTAAPFAVTPQVVPIHDGANDCDHGYGIWAAGSEYKVSFHDGPTFVPYLGRDYPESQSLRWRTTSVTIGEKQLLNGVEPALTYSRFRAEFDHGAVIEAYDVRPEGLEQTFVLAHRPSATGDLVIRGTLETRLEAQPRSPMHAAVTFADAKGNPVARYGAATAIDAAGNRRAMTTAVNGNVVTLQLDGAWLASASYPIVVDPLLGVIYSIAAGASLEAMDLAATRHGPTGYIWHVSQRWASATDADIRYRRFDADGSNDTQVFTDLSANWSTIDPSIGLNEPEACSLLAFTRDFLNGTRRIRFHKHDAGDFGFSSVVRAVDSGTRNAWRPDVANDLSFNNGPDLLIVFQREEGGVFSESSTTDIYGTLVDLQANGGTGTATTPFAISETPFEDHERPVAGAIEGLTQRWPVAYQVIGNNPLFSQHVDWDIDLRVVDSQASVSLPTAVGVGNGQHETGPLLSGFDTELFLANTRSDPAVTGPRPTGKNGQQIWTHRLNWNGSTFSRPTAWRHNGYQDARLELTGFAKDRNDDSHAVFAFRSSATDNVYMRLIGYRAVFLDSETVFVAGANEATTSGAVVFDPNEDRYLIGYCRNSGVNNRTYVDRYHYVSGPHITNSGPGCGSGNLSWVGSQVIGDENCRLQLSNLPVGALGTIVIGTQSVNTVIVGVPPIQPGCWQLVPFSGAGHLVTMPIGFGPGFSFDIDLPEWLGPMTLYCQGVHFNAANTEAYTTDRLTVPLLK